MLGRRSETTYETMDDSLARSSCALIRRAQEMRLHDRSEMRICLAFDECGKAQS
jgi:hypothetical protein